MMTIVDDALANITLLLSFTLFIIVFLRILKTKRWSLAHFFDVIMAIGYSGLVIIILSTKNYQANIPMIIILVVLIIKYFNGLNHDNNEVRS